VPPIGGLSALAGKRVAVFGAGMEGQDFARRVQASCSELVVVDDLAADASPAGIARRHAVEDLTQSVLVAPHVLGERRFDFVVHSPGVSRYDDRLLAAARTGAIVTTPTALFLEDFSGREVVAVTGSKGKSTTAMLTAAALGAYGLDIALAGNIGRPVTELYDDDSHDVFVIELSSFQTAEVTTSPTVGVLTLLAPDHIDWHRSLERYYADKLRVFSLREKLPVAVNATSAEAVARSGRLAGRVLYASAGPVRVEGPGLVAPEIGALELKGFQLLGEHNLINAAGALTAAMLLTGELPDRTRLEAALCAVRAPRSRLEPVGTIGGVRYIDDALASNPEGTLAALRVFRGTKLALIAGGHDRGVDYAPLARAIDESSPQPVVFLLGEAGATLAGALAHISSRVQSRTVSSLEAAVEAAGAWPGIETVLFSPAAPTPTIEGSYLDRGRRFRHAAGLGSCEGESSTAAHGAERGER
jgi:UDP-N-acetylmuramoylalanine--D-glutamate ligase